MYDKFTLQLYIIIIYKMKALPLSPLVCCTVVFFKKGHWNVHNTLDSHMKDFKNIIVCWKTTFSSIHLRLA